MDGYYDSDGIYRYGTKYSNGGNLSNGGNFSYGGNYSNNGIGYPQPPSNNNYGSSCNCPGGNCSWVSGGNQGRGMSREQECPGGNCCPGGRCPLGRSRSNQDWPNYGR